MGTQIQELEKIEHGIWSGLGARRISGEFIRELPAVVLLITPGMLLLAGFS